MKKLTLSVAALSIALTSYGQMSKPDEVKFTKYEVIDMLGDISDILEWQQQDIENGNTSHGSYEEGWGSNYWLRLLYKKLATKISAHGQVNDYLYESDLINCENCDEID